MKKSKASKLESNNDLATIAIVTTASEPLALRLEEELMRARAQLRSSIEQYEIQTEELRASNEELQAINEELRSTAEELETSKEELQSINEELVAVNQELKIKIEELSQSNNDFQNLIYSADIGTVFLDRAFRVKLFTPAAREIFNLIPADIGRPLSAITSRVEHADLIRDAQTVLDKLQTIERDVQIGDGRAFLMQISPYRADRDRIDGVVIVLVNITRRRQAEDELRESEERLRLATEAAAFGIWDWDYRTGIMRWSPRLFDILGIAPTADLTATIETFKPLVHPEDLPGLLEASQQARQNRERFLREYRIFRRDTNELRWLSANEQFFYDEAGEAIRCIGIAHDVTQRKRAEENLRESEERFRAMFEQANVGIVQLTTDGHLLAPNPGFCKFIGYEEEEEAARRLTVRDITHPDDYEREQELMRRLIAGEISGFSIEKRFIPRNGGIVWGNMTATLVRDENGKPFCALSIVEDISERKRAEGELRESEERLRLLIESASDYAIFTLTPDGVVDSWNTGAEKVFGYPEAEIVGRAGEVLFTPEDRRQGFHEKEMKTALEHGRAEDERWHIRRDGSRFLASGVMRPLLDGKVHGFVKIARDQTERIQAEKAVRDKETLKKLIGAQEDERKRIARDLHDHLGQQLTALRLKLEAARKLSMEDAELSAKIDETQIIARHIDDDVDFLAWELRPAALDDLGLIAALDNYAKEWSRHAGVAAEFFHSGLGKERLAPEVETNLYRIAQEALNNVSKHARARSANLILEKRGSLIILIIEDDGAGFDVKEKANRTQGLGLIGMRERAALVGGKIQIESTPNKGATVFVRVPADET